MTGEMDKVGDYVLRALPQALLRNGVEWPSHVEWDRDHLRATITRGELELHVTVRRADWWEPVSKQTGDRLTVEVGRLLYGYWTFYRAADETGRLHVPLWQGPDGVLDGEAFAGGEVVAARLSPGVRLGRGAGGTVVHRFGEPTGYSLQDAVERGWVEVAGR